MKDDFWFISLVYAKCSPARLYDEVVRQGGSWDWLSMHLFLNQDFTLLLDHVHEHRSKHVKIWKRLLPCELWKLLDGLTCLVWPSN